MIKSILGLYFIKYTCIYELSGFALTGGFGEGNSGLNCFKFRIFLIYLLTLDPAGCTAGGYGGGGMGCDIGGPGLKPSRIAA